MSTVHTYEDDASLTGDVASRFLELLEDIQAAGSIPHVVLTGGTIAEEIHRELGRVGPTSGVDWGAVEFWFGDERWLPADDGARNVVQAREAFLDVVGATRVHGVAGSDAGVSLDDAAATYGDEVRASDTHSFDLVMLSIGPDGHVASIFPGHPAADVDAIAVAVTDSPKPPPERVSLSTDALNHSERVWVLAAGEEKREVADAALGGDAGLPAARVHGARETVWFRTP